MSALEETIRERFGDIGDKGIEDIFLIQLLTGLQSGGDPSTSTLLPVLFAALAGRGRKSHRFERIATIYAAYMAGQSAGAANAALASTTGAPPPPQSPNNLATMLLPLLLLGGEERDVTLRSVTPMRVKEKGEKGDDR